MNHTIVMYALVVQILYDHNLISRGINFAIVVVIIIIIIIRLINTICVITVC